MDEQKLQEVTTFLNAVLAVRKCESPYLGGTAFYYRTKQEVLTPVIATLYSRFLSLIGTTVMPNRAEESAFRWENATSCFKGRKYSPVCRKSIEALQALKGGCFYDPDIKDRFRYWTAYGYYGIGGYGSEEFLELTHEDLVYDVFMEFLGDGGEPVDEDTFIEQVLQLHKDADKNLERLKASEIYSLLDRTYTDVVAIIDDFCTEVGDEIYESLLPGFVYDALQSELFGDDFADDIVCYASKGIATYTRREEFGKAPGDLLLLKCLKALSECFQTNYKVTDHKVLCDEPWLLIHMISTDGDTNGMGEAIENSYWCTGIIFDALNWLCGQLGIQPERPQKGE